MYIDQIKKFIFIGILNTVVYYALYSFFVYLKMDYKLSVLFATIIGILFSFKTFKKYVFGSGSKSSIVKFLFAYAILYFANIFFIYLIGGYIDNLYIAGLFATLCCAILSFILNKYYVFKK